VTCLPFIEIEDPDDPRTADYRDVRERDLAGRDGFIAEGAVVLERLIAASAHSVRSVLIARQKIASLGPLLRRLPADVPIYAAGQAVMDQVVGFHIHRGVLAFGLRAPARDPAALLGALPPKALVVALSAISNHDNMGGLFRNAAAFGVAAVLLDAQCCDPLYRKAIRVSVGAALTIPFARMAEGADLPDLLADAGFEALALTPRGGETLGGLKASSRVAAIFGAEGPGLPDSLLDRVRTVRIDMAGGFDSLNVATTSGIVLHHLARGALP
jgi:tRNA G18 (ribose-2'-O)-methylase SpoU